MRNRSTKSVASRSSSSLAGVPSCSQAGGPGARDLRTPRSRRRPSTSRRWPPRSPRGARQPWPARPPGPPGRCRYGPSRGSPPLRCDARSRCGAGASRCRHTVVGGVPRESPSVVSGLVWEPQVCSPRLVRDGGRFPVGSSPWWDRSWSRSSLPRESSSCSASESGALHRSSSRGSCAALLHDIKLS